jgi:uncharacterized small protein (DUF1192 family)
MERLNPAITKYHHHYAAIYHSEDEASLKASAKSIELTVGKDDPNHPDLPLLRVAYSEKLGELRKKAAQEAAEKAKKEAGKVAANA